MTSSFESPKDKLLVAKRILCVQPHYDDNDLGAGALLAMLADRGCELIYLTVTDDLMGVLDVTLSPDQAKKQLRNEQIQAGHWIGVREHFWLDYPDAGEYPYYSLRREVIRFIRWLKPDYLLTCDPWLPYEAHRDHIQTGMAVAEAAILYNLPRLKTEGKIDGIYQPYPLQGVIFTFTHQPNVIVDVTQTYQRKLQAIRCYQSQFTTPDMEAMICFLENNERQNPEDTPAVYAESFRVMSPQQLHINTKGIILNGQRKDT